jgi:class 3 adenylate cyclase/tetratricopeptide (TPR) repeat protein
LVSVLFADLVGFTTLSESRDAEDTRELLSRYFETCKRLVTLYGGTVEKFIGDAVMAVWGTPTATEDDAERAVRAALDLVAAVSALGDEIGAPELRARAGVLTGEAAVTIGAEGQGMVAGDLVNTASRVQSVADPGTVLVGESTRRATESAIVYEEAGAFELKGKEGLTPLWKALRVVSGARGSLKSAGLEAPFVGRDRELRQIKDLFHASAEEHKAHLVSVTGIAGIGKSRLAWEFYKYFDGLPQITYWHRGRCLAYGEGVTYWALADMVRMRCRIVEDEEPDTALQKLHATLEEHLADPEERRFVEPRVSQLLGLAEQEARDKQELFAAWRLFFERLADVYPTVLAFEDMQWADTSLLDFVEYLLEWSRNSPLYVITLARPELLERRSTWGAGHRNFSSLYLEPLPAPAMEELLTGLVPGLPQAVREQILARAEGVPLYAVETVRMLLDRGLLVREGPVYRPAGEIGPLEVPETLHALIAARLDGLSPEERRILQDGAVLGKTFTQAGLAALSGLSESELGPLLSSLVRKEVLGVQADPRSPEHGQYGFLQDLVRHVAYETLSRRERRSRHLAAASHLGSTFPDEDEIVEVVASHYLAAYETAPEAADADEIKAKARAMLARAGERAASLAAAEEAQRYFVQAAGLADVPEQARLLERAGEMAWARARGEEAQELFARALELFESRSLTHPAARVSARLGVVEWRGGRLEPALERMERAYQVLSEDEPDEDLATLAAELGRLHFFKGEVELASERVETAIEIAEALWLPEILSQALNTSGLAASWQGRYEHGMALLKHALDLALEHDRTASAIRAYQNLGDMLERRDRYEDAIDLHRRSLALSEKVGDEFHRLRTLGELSYCFVRQGRWEEALEAAGEIPEQQIGVAAWGDAPLEVAIARGDLSQAHHQLSLLANLADAADLQDRVSYLAARARVRRAEGDYEAALADSEETLRLAQLYGAGISGDAKVAFVEALEAAFALGAHEKVEELLARIENIKRGQRPPFLHAQLARFRALLAAGAGDAGEVEAGFKTAEAIFREYGIAFWLAVTELEHSEWLVARGRGDEAEPLLGEARETFERLEAKPLLERTAQVSPPRREPEAVSGRS